MEKKLSNFPKYLVDRFIRIPDPEKKNVLKEAGMEEIDENFVPDEDDIAALDEAIRYKDAKLQLIRLMLEGMIEDDLNDRLEAKEMADSLIWKYPASEVLKIYETKFRAEAN